MDCAVRTVAVSPVVVCKWMHTHVGFGSRKGHGGEDTSAETHGSSKERFERVQSSVLSPHGAVVPVCRSTTPHWCFCSSLSCCPAIGAWLPSDHQRTLSQQLQEGAGPEEDFPTFVVTTRSMQNVKGLHIWWTNAASLCQKGFFCIV